MTVEAAESIMRSVTGMPSIDWRTWAIDSRPTSGTISAGVVLCRQNQWNSIAMSRTVGSGWGYLTRG